MEMAIDDSLQAETVNLIQVKEELCPRRTAMSALGQKQTSEQLRAMSALPPKADIAERYVLSVKCHLHMVDRR
jgi:hypothetical protein